MSGYVSVEISYGARRIITHPIEGTPKHTLDRIRAEFEAIDEKAGEQT